MSKYDEMCKAYGDAKKVWMEYYNRGMQQVSALTTGFIKYCEIPPGSFSFVPAKDPDANSSYTPITAIRFGDDGYWHIGWRISLPHPVLVTVFLREIEADNISVRCGWEKQDRILDLKDESQCRAFYEVVIHRITEFYKRSAEDTGKPVRTDKLGFQVL
jgi:hypothetical protein